MIKMRLFCSVVEKGREHGWGFSRIFETELIPRKGEGVGIGSRYAVVGIVIHDIKTGIVEVTCHCDFFQTSIFFSEFSDWRVNVKEGFLKDKAEILKHMDCEDFEVIFEEDYEDEE